jgi:hypothetical protein
MIPCGIHLMNKTEKSCTSSSSYNIFLLINGSFLERKLALRQSMTSMRIWQCNLIVKCHAFGRRA